jgi:hypothetical protein
MDSDSTSGELRGPDASQATRFSALRWEREIANRFLAWRTTSTVQLELMRTFGRAVVEVLRGSGHEAAESGDLAAALPSVLRSCDDLSFDGQAEALAYAGFHLLDRYGRVDQVLEYLLRIGRLPLRLGGVRVLEVGSGPAPVLYATRDFYASLRRWPELGSVEVGPVVGFDTLDRGRAWDSFLHHLSESLMIIRGNAEDDGCLAFARSAHELSGFDVWERHHSSVARSAERIMSEFDRADEWIPDSWARQMAYGEGMTEPSAYDVIVLCYFLTHESMPKRFAVELRRLAVSLTPGGLLILVGSTAAKYRNLYSQLRAIAAAAKLREVSPQEVFQANDDSYRRLLVANHVRGNVEFALASAPSAIRSQVVKALPKDVVDDRVEFRLPKFQALAFVRQGPPLKGSRRELHRSKV